MAIRHVNETGRALDPPLLLVLDEAANIAPIQDLDTLASTGAGLGIQLVTVCQDLAQLAARYGPERSRTIANNHRAKLLLSGVSDLATLDLVSGLAGEAAVREDTYHRRPAGRATDPLQCGRLPAAGAGRRAAAHPTRAMALLIYGHLPPVRLRLATLVSRTAGCGPVPRPAPVACSACRGAGMTRRGVWPGCREPPRGSSARNGGEAWPSGGRVGTGLCPPCGGRWRWKRAGDYGALRARLGATRGGSPGIFGYTGGQGASGKPGGERPGVTSPAAARVTAASAPAQGSPARAQAGRRPTSMVNSSGWMPAELVPPERRRHLGAGPGPHRPGAEHRLVGGVLVEVDEHPRCPAPPSTRPR